MKDPVIGARFFVIFLIALLFGIPFSVAQAARDFDEVTAAAAETAEKTAGTVEETYSVQVGAFQNEKNAAALVEKLKRNGYNARILNGTGRAAYKVLVGKFASRTEAVVQAKLVFKREGLRSIIFREKAVREVKTTPLVAGEVKPVLQPQRPAPASAPEVKTVPAAAKVPALEVERASTLLRPMGGKLKSESQSQQPAPAQEPKTTLIEANTVRQSQQPAAEKKPESVAGKAAPSLSGGFSVKLTADKTSPVMATATGPVVFATSIYGESGSYEYRFWFKGPSTQNEWKIARDYGESASYSWTPTMAGNYVIWVCVRHAPSSAGSEASAWMLFDVVENPPVASVTLTADKVSPALRSTLGRVTFTPHAVGGSGMYEYKFWLNGPSTGGVWKVAQDYGISDSFSWVPTQAGHYLIWAYARNAGSGAACEAALWTSFDVVDNSPVESVELIPDKASPVPLSADSITFSARASGGSGTYEYKFWLKGPSTRNAWIVAQDYGLANAFSWTPAKAGDYLIAVYARNGGSPAGHEAIAGVAFTVNGK